MPYDHTAMRTVIDISNEQVQALADYCAAAHVSRAEAVRRAVRLLTAQGEVEQRELDAALDESFGIWEDRKIDARELVNALREEWAEREERIWSSVPSSTATC